MRRGGASRDDEGPWTSVLVTGPRVWRMRSPQPNRSDVPRKVRARDRARGRGWSRIPAIIRPLRQQLAGLVTSRDQGRRLVETPADPGGRHRHARLALAFLGEGQGELYLPLASGLMVMSYLGR